MFYKISLAVMTLGAQFLVTGWIYNWAPLDTMLTVEEYYADDCYTRSSSPPCPRQQVELSKLWSGVLLTECTILPAGILLDYIGPSLFSLFLFFIHVSSLVIIVQMPKDTPMLYIPFFMIGTASNACALLVYRTVYIFKTPRARQVWLVAAGTLFDSSAVLTIILYQFWDHEYLTLDDIFWLLAILGAVLYGSIALLWVGFKIENCKSGSYLTVNEDGPMVVSLFDIITCRKFYFFIFLTAVNIYRLKYYLGLVVYTLNDLNDDGMYLQLFGWSFAFIVPLAPFVNMILSKLKSQFSHLNCMNVSILAFFVTWMIPSLQLQFVTFILFNLARLFTFTVLNEYCSQEFPAERFGFVVGAGFLGVAIPGQFTYKIVEVVLVKYNGNFLIFHIICISMSIPVFLVTWYLQRNSETKGKDFQELPSDPDAQMSERPTVMIRD